jgi:glycine hydroxymethyltransferase
MSNRAIHHLIEKEKERQNQTINLIASENYASQEVMNAMGSVLTNKYAEGYPGARYYGGCSLVDEIEQEAIARAKELFNAEHANVQPHSGSSANMAVYFSMLNPGDTILGMNLSAGGHLTHGHPLNFSGKLFNIISYGVNPENEAIDYEELEKLAQKHQPKMIVAGASAYSLIIDFEQIAQIARSCNALFLADIAHIAGLVVAKLHPSPFPHADFVTTTTHKTLRGPRGGMILCKEEYAKKIDRSVFPGMQGGPLMHVIAAKAIAFQEALLPSFVDYQKQVLLNASTMAHAFKEKKYRLVGGRTENHLLILDLKSKDPALTGKMIEKKLENCNIIVNRNMIPFDKESPLQTSGIRIGTPAITTRKMGTKEVIKIVDLIDQIIMTENETLTKKEIEADITELIEKHPLY